MNALDVNAWRLACPHSMSSFYPVPAFKQDVTYRPWSMATLTLVGIGLVVGMKVVP